MNSTNSTGNGYSLGDVARKLCGNSEISNQNPFCKVIPAEVAEAGSDYSEGNIFHFKTFNIFKRSMMLFKDLNLKMKKNRKIRGARRKHHLPDKTKKRQ